MKDAEKDELTENAGTTTTRSNQIHRLAQLCEVDVNFWLNYNSVTIDCHNTVFQYS